jgi:hypothetical protein
MRYYIANDDNIPYHAQPAKGYTKLQVILKVQIAIKECVKMYGGKFEDYKSWFHILDSNFNEVHDFDNAI